MDIKFKSITKKQGIIIAVIVVFAVILVGSTIYCAVNDENPKEMLTDIFTTNDQQIVGKWQNSENPGLSAYEFYDDGTYDSYLSTFAFTGEYKIEGNKITLSNPNSNKTVVYKISLNANSLTMELVEEDGEEPTESEVNQFDRVDNLNMKSITDLISDLADTSDDDDSTTTTEEPTTGSEQSVE